MAVTTAPAAAGGTHAGVAKPWFALVVASLAQLMIALDATVINIALPSAQAGLHIDDAQRQWIVTSYTLAFGGLLLIGGELSDLWGRRQTFLIGLAGFALASVFGGLSNGFVMLVIGRAVQGFFAALIAPAVLSLLAVTFTEPRERARAFALFGSIVSAGSAIGLLVGGALTEWANWRWCFFVNIPVALGALVAGRMFLPILPKGDAQIDVPGALVASAGLVAIVYGLGGAATKGWGSTAVLGPIVGGVVLLAVFGLIESRAPEPLLPLRILRNRTRLGTYVVLGAGVIGMYGLFLLLSYYLQVIKHYSPAGTGFAFLPMTLTLLATSNLLTRRLLPKLPPRLLITPGLLIASSGLFVFSGVQLSSGYGRVFLAEMLMGFGMSFVFTPAITNATASVAAQEAGVASAVANTCQQIGASVGVALLNSLAAATTSRFLRAHHSADRLTGLLHGYSVAVRTSGAIMVVSAGVAWLLVASTSPSSRAGGNVATLN